MLLRPRRRTAHEEILEYLKGIGVMMQTVDAKLEEIVKLLKEDNDEPGS